jgi:hypothetical protein
MIYWIQKGANVVTWKVTFMFLFAGACVLFIALAIRIADLREMAQ